MDSNNVVQFEMYKEKSDAEDEIETVPRENTARISSLIVTEVVLSLIALGYDVKKDSEIVRDVVLMQTFLAAMMDRMIGKENPNHMVSLALTNNLSDDTLNKLFEDYKRMWDDMNPEV